MEKPSFKSSPWIRGAPHRVFSPRHPSDQIADLPRHRRSARFSRRDFHVQKSLNALRCQPMTVSGLTITRAWRQPGHRQDRMTQKTLSAFRSNGRGLFRFRTATCCRRARISVWSAARSAKISMILCMPERVSGGDAKFQGFCHRWNKWEGQSHGATAKVRENAVTQDRVRVTNAIGRHPERSGFLRRTEFIGGTTCCRRARISVWSARAVREDFDDLMHAGKGIRW